MKGKKKFNRIKRLRKVISTICQIIGARSWATIQWLNSKRFNRPMAKVIKPRRAGIEIGELLGVLVFAGMFIWVIVILVLSAQTELLPP